MNFDDLFRTASDRPTKAKAVEATIALDKILDRKEDTRALNQKHVEALAESIAALGLIEPIVVDIKGRLLAGGHRKEAIVHLREDKPEAFDLHFPGGQVPVRVMAIDAEVNPELAIQVEVAENEKRKDYTPEEVRSLAKKLLNNGWVDRPGRPKTGEKPLRPAIELIIGKSYRTVQRYLEEEDKGSDEPKTLTDVHISLALSALRKALRGLKECDRKDISLDPLKKYISYLEKLKNASSE